MSFIGYRSGNSQPSGCARVQTEDRFVAPPMEAQNGVRLYLYFAFVIYLFIYLVGCTMFLHLPAPI